MHDVARADREVALRRLRKGQRPDWIAEQNPRHVIYYARVDLAAEIGCMDDVDDVTVGAALCTRVRSEQPCEVKPCALKQCASLWWHAPAVQFVQQVDEPVAVIGISSEERLRILEEPVEWMRLRPEACGIPRRREVSESWVGAPHCRAARAWRRTTAPGRRRRPSTHWQPICSDVRICPEHRPVEWLVAPHQFVKPPQWRRLSDTPDEPLQTVDIDAPLDSTETEHVTLRHHGVGIALQMVKAGVDRMRKTDVIVGHHRDVGCGD